MEPSLLDAAGHRRSPVTMPGYHRGRPPRNKGRRYPADPPTIDEIIAVMRAAGSGKNAARLRALVVLLWRAGLRVSEAFRSGRVRSRPPARRDPDPPRQRRQTPRSRNGQLGLAATGPVA